MGYDSGSIDEYVLTNSINNVTSLLIDNKNISDLTGIEYFSSLITLSCDSNFLKSIDVSHNNSLVNGLTRKFGLNRQKRG